MPSGADFKYQTGDTTEWRNKYYALVDYLIATGQSVTDIEAYLAENSDFNPGSVPTALASLNAVAASTSDNAEYQITHGTPYTSFAPNMWFLVRMPSANTGAMTLKVDGLAAKSVRIGGAATAGGEFAANVVYLFTYDAINDRFEALGPSSGTKTLAAKDADYTLQAGDLGGFAVVPIDIDGQDVDIKELALASMKGVVRYVVSAWDGAGDAYKARVIDASDAEVATLYAEGDFVDIAYDGTTRTIGPERVTVRGEVYLTADDSIGNGATEKVFDANISEDTDVGGWFDATTNFRITAAFDCVLRVDADKVASGDDLLLFAYIDASPVQDLSGTSGADISPYGTYGWTLTLTAGQTVEVYAKNYNGGASFSLMGDAAKDESSLKWFVLGRTR